MVGLDFPPQAVVFDVAHYAHNLPAGAWRTVRILARVRHVIAERLAQRIPFGKYAWTNASLTMAGDRTCALHLRIVRRLRGQRVLLRLEFAAALDGNFHGFEKLRADREIVRGLTGFAAACPASESRCSRGCR